MAAPKTAPTVPLRDGWHGPADQNRACGAVWIALGAVLAIVVAPCFSHPSVETMCLGIACLYSGRSSIRLGVEQLRAGRRVSVDRETAPGTRLIAGDEIERFEVGSDGQHERLAPACGEHERLAPAPIVVVARRGPVTLPANDAPRSTVRVARQGLASRRAAALDECLRAERSPAPLGPSRAPGDPSRR